MQLGQKALGSSAAVERLLARRTTRAFWRYTEHPCLSITCIQSVLSNTEPLKALGETEIAKQALKYDHGTENHVW